MIVIIESSTRILVAVFSLLKGFDPAELFEYINTESNRDELTQDVSAYEIIVKFVCDEGSEMVIGDTFLV